MHYAFLIKIDLNKNLVMSYATVMSLVSYPTYYFLIRHTTSYDINSKKCGLLNCTLRFLLKDEDMASQTSASQA